MGSQNLFVWISKWIAIKIAAIMNKRFLLSLLSSASAIVNDNVEITVRDHPAFK